MEALLTALQINPITLIPSATVSLLGTVGAERFDSYTINLNEPQSIEVNLFNLSNNADILLTDANSNPIPTGGGSQPGSNPENFTVNLNPGSYQVQVFQPLNDISQGGTNYQLDLISTSSSNPPNNPPNNPPVNPETPPNLNDNSNDNINTPTPLGTLVPEIPLSRVAEINDFDPVDYYRITVDRPIIAGVALQNLTDNIDVAVLDSNGVLIALGNNTGASNEAFQALLPTPGEYLINVFQTTPGVATEYELALFPASADNINQPPPPPPPSQQPATISIDSTVDINDEAIRNVEGEIQFKEDYLLVASPNTEVSIDLIGKNNGFDPLIKVYQLPKDSLLVVDDSVLPVAANNNGGGGVNARIGPGVPSDVTAIPPGSSVPIQVSSQLTLSPDFNYLVRVTHEELRLNGNYTLTASVPSGSISLDRVLFGNPIGNPTISENQIINSSSIDPIIDGGTITSEETLSIEIVEIYPPNPVDLFATPANNLDLPSEALNSFLETFNTNNSNDFEGGGF